MRLGLLILVSMLMFGTPLGVSGAADIKIGVAEALPGNASQYGVAIRKGFELAAGEINSL